MCWAKKALLGDTPAGLFLFQVARSLIDTKILMTQAEQLALKEYLEAKLSRTARRAAA